MRFTSPHISYFFRYFRRTAGGLAHERGGGAHPHGGHREDAVATLDLYLRYIACDPHLMAEEELMQHYLEDILLYKRS